jgi:tRNA pseudouridine38-40 synthase
MKNVLLTIEYDGTNFSGWQRQPGRRTVQGELERVLSILCKQEVKLKGTSRTDAGVHAFDQRAGFRGEFGIPIDRIPVAANRLLAGEGPFAVGDVRIREAKEVHAEFHPRFDAKGKKYIYKIRNAPQPDIMQRNYSYQIERPLNLQVMKQAAAFLIGEQDFRSFMAAGGNVPESTVRTIYNIEWKQRFLEECERSPVEDCGPLSDSAIASGDQTIAFDGTIAPNTCAIASDDGGTTAPSVRAIDFEITGNGFLYNMVRIIVGTLVDVGLGKIAPDEMKTIIQSGNRQQAGHTAPPGGLYLAEVYFDEEDLIL